MSKRKYIFVVGGVMSGVGKGISSSSIATIMKSKGFKVTALKIDPYINVDAGTMNPTEHGEVFVLRDGDECDQDMGNYERFLNTSLTRDNYMTTGRVYQEVIRRERNLEYKGKNVEVVPDIPYEVIRRIKKASDEVKSDITIIEVGGTIGEYQNIIFLEAIRMLKIQNPRDVATVMVSYLPMPSKIGEMKTKPTQYAARTLNAAGVQADVIVARSDLPLDNKRKEKIATFCNVPAGQIISAPDADSIYDIPVNFEKDNLGDTLLDILRLPKRKTDLSEWKQFISKRNNAKKEVNIAIVGKYFDSGDFVLSDVYISVIEAVKFSAYYSGAKPKLSFINSKDFEKDKSKISILKNFDGILVPGGFGESGVEGIVETIRFARENKIPYFGICYGMQLMVIEYARNVLGWKDANTREINPKASKLVIDIMHDQKKKLEQSDYGNSMRLGDYTAILKDKTIARAAYGKSEIVERHRHRYEVNPQYVDEIESKGLVFSGKSKDGTLCEIAELPVEKHPFFLGVQFHPEFLARPLSPHKIFTEFVKSALKNKKS
jgi:CTP synthase